MLASERTAPLFAGAQKGAYAQGQLALEARMGKPQAIQSMMVGGAVTGRSRMWPRRSSLTER